MKIGEKSRIRLDGVKSLINNRFDGVQLSLANTLGKHPSQISDWMTGRQNIGNALAREIEAKLDLPQGWLDSDQSADVPAGYVAFNLLDVRAGAGSGIVPSEQIEVVRQIHVLESWAHANIGRDLSRIRVITAHGLSMQGTIENGDVLFVDSSVHAFDGDGIYVISRENEIQVKRLQKLQGNVLAVISDNKLFETEHLSESQADSVTISGRVVAAWSVKKFW